ncbi:MAG: DUF4465 domain-containing protein [Bacteroidota bacterium]
MNIRILLICLLAWTISPSQAQEVLDFEELTLEADTFWSGVDMSGQFQSGGLTFPNGFDFGFWLGGWAYSNRTDSVTSGPDNSFSAKTAKGFNGSDNYVLGKSDGRIYFDQSHQVSGFYVTNSTYAYNSMRDGDDFAKMFGGDDGDDEDFFVLSVKGFSGGQLVADSVVFYLADYRFEDNSMDYIVDTWEWVDLTSLGTVDSLLFSLNSSDVGTYGMNTPNFFCIDHIGLDGFVSTKSPIEAPLFSLSPNPANDFAQIQLADPAAFTQLWLMDMQGRTYAQENISGNQQHRLDLAHLPNGLYLIAVQQGEQRHLQKLLIQR